MKKLLSMLLITALCCIMAVPASAEQTPGLQRMTTNAILISNRGSEMIVHLQNSAFRVSAPGLVDGYADLCRMPVDSNTVFLDQHGNPFDSNVLVPGQSIRVQFTYEPPEHHFLKFYATAISLEKLTLTEDIREIKEKIEPESLPPGTAIGTIAQIRRAPPNEPGESYNVAEVYIEAGQIDRMERNHMIGNIYGWRWDGVRLNDCTILDATGKTIPWQSLQPGQRVKLTGGATPLFVSYPLIFEFNAKTIQLLDEDAMVIDPETLALYTKMRCTVLDVVDFYDEDSDDWYSDAGYKDADKITLWDSGAGQYEYKYLVRAETDSWAGRQQELYYVEDYYETGYKPGDELFVEYSMIDTSSSPGTIHACYCIRAEEVSTSLAQWDTVR